MNDEPNQGKPGAPGATGRTGEAGVSGPAGTAGTSGVAGPAGERGLPGRSGLAGLTGREGEQGVQGERGESGRTPRTVWLSRLAYVIFAAGLLVALAFAIQQGQKAIDKVEHEQSRADDAICRIAASNRGKLVALLTGVRVYVSRDPFDPPATDTLAFLDAQIAEARQPFPEPCTPYSLPEG